MPEPEPPIHLLLIEDNPGDALLTRTALESIHPDRYRIAHVESLNAAVAPLAQQHFDAILLDLALPDTRGLATLTHLRGLAPNTPIVVLTGTDDERLVMEAVRRGAQDCLTKGAADGRGLVRAIRYALDRQQAVEALRASEDRLRQWNQGLEKRVQERTAALAQVARKLEEENAQRREIQRQLEAYQRNLQAMAHQVLVAEEQERHRLATDLHDGLGQTLTLAKMKLTELRRDAGATPLAVACQEVVKLIDEARRATSNLTFELSPPILHELGLAPAVRWLAEDLGERYALSVEVEDDTLPKPLAEQVTVMLFRATRELLINVAKHAQTKQARVTLCCLDGHVRVTVEDRGVGFDPTHHADVALDRTAPGFPAPGPDPGLSGSPSSDESGGNSGGGNQSPVSSVQCPVGNGERPRPDARPTKVEAGGHSGSEAGGGGTGGFGLFSLRERLNYLGGSMEVRSAPDQGTTITLIAPLTPRGRDSRK